MFALCEGRLQLLKISPKDSQVELPEKFSKEVDAGKEMNVSKENNRGQGNKHKQGIERPGGTTLATL